MQYDNFIEKEYKLFINGEWKSAENNNMYEKYDPVTNELITRCALASKNDVDYSIRCAKIAFKDWKKTSKIERSNILLKIADILETNIENLAIIESIQTGKPIRETLYIDIPNGIEHLRYFASVIRSFEEKSTFINDELISIIRNEPLGVVAQIVPWNFPFLMGMWKLAPALAMGNCIIFKPASETPISILETMKLIKDVLPAGVLNILTGFGDTTGNYITEHPEIKKIAFTGSTQIGYNIAKAAAEKIIPCTLELGGKSANIFFEDMQFDKAIEGACTGILFNQGQICSAGSRAFVQDSIYDKFVKELKHKFENIKLGFPLEMDTQMGSLINMKQLERCLKYIEIGKTEGAKILTGGKKSNIKELRNGAFLEPTILIDVKNNMRIAQEEIFGPVLCIIKFHSEEEVIQMANDSIYGLAGGVWTKDINRAVRVAESIETGKIWINCYNESIAGTPFGGYKKSGIGRESHKMVLNAYSQVKNIMINLNEDLMGIY